MLREVWLNIGVEKIDTHEGVMIKVLFVMRAPERKEFPTHSRT